MSTREQLLLVITITVLASGFYLKYLQEQTQKSTPAYVYNPATDELYVATTTPGLGTPGRWKYKLPYKTALVGDLDNIKYRGRLADLTASLNKGKSTRDIQQEKIASLYVISAPDYYEREDLDTSKLLPAAWQSISDYIGNKERDIIAADIVIMKFQDEALSNAAMQQSILFVRGEAAKQLEMMGYF